MSVEFAVQSRDIGLEYTAESDGLLIVVPATSMGSNEGSYQYIYINGQLYAFGHTYFTYGAASTTTVPIQRGQRYRVVNAHGRAPSRVEFYTFN